LISDFTPNAQWYQLFSYTTLFRSVIRRIQPPGGESIGPRFTQPWNGIAAKLGLGDQASLSSFDKVPWQSVGCIAVKSLATNGLRSEEHTSELQSRGHLVCRLLLED